MSSLIGICGRSPHRAGPQIGVPLLNCRIAGPAVSGRDRIGFGNAPHADVAGADGAHLARLNEAIEGFHRLFERSGGVIAMCVVQVKPVRAEPLQAHVALRAQFPQR
jgi:hypothetical protein